MYSYVYVTRWTNLFIRSKINSRKPFKAIVKVD